MTIWINRRKKVSAALHPDHRKLSDLLDGELTGRSRRLVETHLSVCETCASLLAELHEVSEQGFRCDESSAPARDLWPEIQRRLVARPNAAPSRGWVGWPWWHVGQQPATVVAVVAILVVAVAAAVAWRAFSTIDSTLPITRYANQSVASPTGLSDQQYTETLASLRRVVYTRLTADSRLLDVIDDNLATIDVAIANYREALTRAPDDGELRSRIAAAQQRKLDVLRQAAALATEGNN